VLTTLVCQTPALAATAAAPALSQQKAEASSTKGSGVPYSSCLCHYCHAKQVHALLGFSPSAAALLLLMLLWGQGGVGCRRGREGRGCRHPAWAGEVGPPSAEGASAEGACCSGAQCLRTGSGAPLGWGLRPKGGGHSRGWHALPRGPDPHQCWASSPSAQEARARPRGEQGSASSTGAAQAKGQARACPCCSASHVR